MKSRTTYQTLQPNGPEQTTKCCERIFFHSLYAFSAVTNDSIVCRGALLCCVGDNMLKTGCTLQASFHLQIFNPSFKFKSKFCGFCAEKQSDTLADQFHFCFGFAHSRSVSPVQFRFLFLSLANRFDMAANSDNENSIKWLPSCAK